MLEDIKMPELFIYGTLKNPDVQKEVIGRLLWKSRPDALFGYRLSRIEIEGKEYPTIEPDPRSRVNGFVVYVSKRELSLLDAYETRSYKRVLRRLESGIRAWVYKRSSG